MSKTVLYHVNQFGISTQSSSIWPIDRALSGATTPAQSGPESAGKEEVLRIPQSSSIIGTSPSDCLVSYPGLSLKWGVLPLCRDAVGVFYSPSWLDKCTPVLVYKLLTAKMHTSVSMQVTDCRYAYLCWYASDWLQACIPVVVFRSLTAGMWQDSTSYYCKIYNTYENENP